MRTNFTLLEVLPLNRYVTVREMTVAEIRVFIQKSGVLVRGLLLMTDLLPEEIERLSEDEIARLLNEGLALNAAFFSEDGGQKTEDSQLPAAKPQDDSPQSSVIRPLELAVARMVRVGHVNAWDYPWRVFKAAVEEAEGAAGGKS